MPGCGCVSLRGSRSASGAPDRRLLPDDERVRGCEVYAVRVVQVSRGASRMPGMAVLPDDSVCVRIDDDDAVVVVVVENDVAAWERFGKRGVVEWRGAGEGLVTPAQASVAVECFESAGTGVVDAEVEARLDLIGVGGVAEAGWMPGAKDASCQAELIDPVTVDFCDEEVSVAHREGAVGTAKTQGRGVEATL